MHGFGRYFDNRGRLKCVANHKNGLKYGVLWQISKTLILFIKKFFFKFQVAPPNFFVFMLKYVMIFAVGIFSGFWVWSGKLTLTEKFSK